MQSKKILAMAIVVVFGCASVSLGISKDTSLKIKKLQFLKLMYTNYNFVSSSDYKNAPDTIGQFFTEPIYKKLRGNDIIGFSYDQGFTYSGDAWTLKQLKTTAQSGKYREHFVNTLNQVARDGRFAVRKDTGYEMGICLVTVVEKGEGGGLPGVVVELYLKNVKLNKSLFLRIKSGSKKGWYEGMRNAWRYIYILMKGSSK